MTDWNWQSLGLQGAFSFVSGAVGWGIGLWKAGRDSARKEQAVKDDYVGRIGTLREDVRASMDKHEKAFDDRNDLLVGQFKESFEGLRRQHDDHKLDVERRFMLKDDFRDFRDEYREDMRDLKASIATITSANKN